MYLLGDGHERVFWIEGEVTDHIFERRRPCRLQCEVPRKELQQEQNSAVSIRIDSYLPPQLDGGGQRHQTPRRPLDERSGLQDLRSRSLQSWLHAERETFATTISLNAANKAQTAKRLFLSRANDNEKEGKAGG